MPDDPHAQVEHLFSEHFPLVEQTLASFGVPPSQIPDTAAEVFVVAYRRLISDDTPVKDPRAWLYEIAHRTASTVRKRTRRIPENVPLSEAPALMEDAPAPDVKATHRELLSLLFRDIDDDHTSVFVARELYEMSWEEIATMHGISASGARKRYQSALEDLQSALRRWTAREERRGVVVLPITLAHLLDAARAPLEGSEARRRAAQGLLHRRLKGHVGGPMESRAQPGPSLGDAPLVFQVVAQPSLHLGQAITLLFSGMAFGGVVVFLLMSEPTRTAPAPPPSDSSSAPILVRDIPARSTVLSTSAVPSGSASSSRSVFGNRGEPARNPPSQNTDWKLDMALLDQAGAALAKRDALTALSVLVRHREQFPHSPYARKRDAMLAQICVLPDARAAVACSRARSAGP